MERLIYLIEHEIKSVELQILSGYCPDYPSYREHVGMLTAYRATIELVKKAFTEEGEE